MTERTPDPTVAETSVRMEFGMLVALNLLLIRAVAAWWLAQMCNRARLRSEPETLHARFGSNWAADAVRPTAIPSS